MIFEWELPEDPFDPDDWFFRTGEGPSIPMSEFTLGERFPRWDEPERIVEDWHGIARGTT